MIFAAGLSSLSPPSHRFFHRLVTVGEGRDAAGLIHRRCRRTGWLGWRLVTARPIDDVAQRPPTEIGAKVIAEQIDAAMAVLVAGAGDMRRNQHPRIGP